MKHFEDVPSNENEAETPIEKIARLEAENKRLSEENAELKEANKILEKSATKDPLTDVYNRRGLREELRHIIQSAENERRDIEPKDNAVLMLDIDNFKKINDTYGHDAGDEILRQAADFLKGHMRETDIICRWGGEEFVIVMQDMNAKAVIKKFYNEESKQAEMGFVAMADGKEIPVTFSGGVSELAPGESIVKTIARADKGLYQAKNQGKNMILEPGEEK